MLFEDKVKFTVFGSSHSEAIGVSIEGIGFGETVDMKELQAFVDRRKATGACYSTKRLEPDTVVIERGIENGVTSGGEIVAKIYNTNVRSSDYSAYKTCPRPSHADYAAICKYGSDYDVSGGGRFSGRMTAPMCIAGGIAIQLLAAKGIRIGGYIQSIGSVCGKGYKLGGITEEGVMSVHNDSFPLLDGSVKNAMMREIERASLAGDSCGGVVECVVFGVPAGSGDVMRNSIESEISRNLFAIPAVKGVEFGSGFDIASMRGSSANDEFYFDENGQVKTLSNHNGGINGGLANGMPITVRVAFKPVPSISIAQRTVNLATGENTTVTVKGRHDSCFVPRAVPVVEAMVALAVINCVAKK
ncbi:MAG: chorismate synthase [Clostridia bacterium]|nr:chorismate synthase [Clostridia bacterium]